MHVDENIEENYNKEKMNYRDYMAKDENVEDYSSRHVTTYFNERRICYIKEESFNTARLYNDSIGITTINIDTYLFNTGNNILTKDNIEKVILELKKYQFELLLRSFKDEYLEKIM